MKEYWAEFVEQFPKAASESDEAYLERFFKWMVERGAAFPDTVNCLKRDNAKLQEQLQEQGKTISITVTNMTDLRLRWVYLFLGCLGAGTFLGLIQDLMGKELYFRVADSGWVDSKISGPIEVMILLVIVVVLVLKELTVKGLLKE